MMDHFSYSGSFSKAILKPSARKPVTPIPKSSPSPIAWSPRDFIRIRYGRN